MALRYLFGKPRLILLNLSYRNASCCSAELLAGRSVLNVKRESCSEFLQGLITNDINLLTTQSCVYAMLLNAKGRVLHDVLVYRTESPDEMNIECSSDAVDSINKHLKVYSLRKRIEIVKSNLSVWAIFNIDEASHDFPADPRCSQPWVFRHLSASPPCDSQVQGVYSKLRYSLGIAEGPREIPIGEAFPLEYNADLLNGVSFDKGCYVGQELTARIHHTGVIRKRIMPIELSEEATNDAWDAEDPIKDSDTGKVVGKIRGVIKNRALALMRVTETIAAKGLNWGPFKVKASIPKWWPPLVKESDVVKRQ